MTSNARPSLEIVFPAGLLIAVGLLGASTNTIPFGFWTLKGIPNTEFFQFLLGGAFLLVLMALLYLFIYSPDIVANKWELLRDFGVAVAVELFIAQVYGSSFIQIILCIAVIFAALYRTIRISRPMAAFMVIMYGVGLFIAVIGFLGSMIGGRGYF